MTDEQQATVQAAADAAADLAAKVSFRKKPIWSPSSRSKVSPIYEPDLAAFRNQVQSMYLESEFAETWPDGVLEKINALGN